MLPTPAGRATCGLTTLGIFAGRAALQSPTYLWIGGLEDGRLQDLQTARKSGTELDQVIDQDVPSVQLRYLNSPAASL